MSISKENYKATAHKVSHWVAFVILAVSWILAVAAVATENWTGSTAKTSATSSTLGDISIQLTIGLFRIVSKTCCFVSGQLVYDFQSVCQIAPPNNGCTDAALLTSKFCDLLFVRRSLGDTTCGNLEIASVVCAILVIFVLVATVVSLAMLALRRYLVVAVIATAFSAMASIVVCALVSELMVKVLSKFFASRYGTNSPMEIHSSFGLFIAHLVLHLLALVFMVTSWLLRPKPPAPSPPPMPAPMPEPVEERDIHVLTPAPVTNPVHSQFYYAEPAALPICPADPHCPFVNDFSHHLQYAHACREPLCNDYSPAHRRHFYHD